MRTITYRELRDALLEVLVEHGPDTVYESPEENGQCVYVTAEGDPSCIFGHAFKRLGFDITALRGKDARPGRAAFKLGALLENPALGKASSICQSLQDGKAPWGDAVERFITEYERSTGRA